MCFGKFFSSSRGQRSNAGPEAAGSVRPSLANVPQLSVDNVPAVKSSKSMKSAKAAAAASHGTFNVSNQLAPSVNTMASEARKSGLGGATTTDIPASVSGVPNAGGPASGSAGTISNQRSGRRTSWWGYFGMSKKKNSSIESL
ncbi:hypothetical protein KR054_008766 [Drosophila jambulina]|nr:hypothetical protein KR054_008766 [Drosophila jambulina]